MNNFKSKIEKIIYSKQFAVFMMITGTVFFYNIFQKFFTENFSGYEITDWLKLILVFTIFSLYPIAIIRHHKKA